MEDVLNVEDRAKAVADAVAEAGDIPQKTAKQQERERKQEERYWNSMISRSEARDIVIAMQQQQDEKLRMLFVSVSSIIQVLKDKNVCTQEELDAFAKPVIQSLYGIQDKPPEEEQV